MFVHLAPERDVSRSSGTSPPFAMPAYGFQQAPRHPGEAGDFFVLRPGALEKNTGDLQ
jgi:hypothetical protein